jgi:alpha-ribazole phosphatase
MKPFALHLMRHGAPSLTGRLLGRTDCDVTPAGIAACRNRAEAIRYDALVTSDLARARACADTLGNARADARWRELDFGAWDGLYPADVDAGAIARFWDDPDAHPPPGGERWSALVARVAAAIDALPPQPTLVVTHGGAMRAALAHLCGLSQAATWAFDLPYAAVLSLSVWEGSPRRGQVTGLRT